ncbi:30S ribosomal protein S8 [Enterobacteriaceae endosymbiont of Macroplea appendiculata]|uniref:30S ribosomal protein S8 n=1 Tax=Enterobacteriaceae endosymbiont of Macroplea appendiculata TaxID=2675790 RepID=UPI001449CEE5|nr:30S ribosomal protein S8 [Enterobacteriaceae endosymbiont of Macroplea appendiculata]QJC30872.1 30S ribosomal protein S8 [Enterobacteriaceae endosymbiont of Macroplea appendiculata]
MSIQDPIADMLTRIRNGQLSKKSEVIMQYSKYKQAIAQILQNEGYIKNFFIIKKKHIQLGIILKYFNGTGVIETINYVSKPGLRIYKKKNKLPRVMTGLGITIISTSKGVITDYTARKYGVGGEIICYVA